MSHDNICLFSIPGVGGTTDTANTGRKFFGEKRDQFLELVDVSTAQFSVGNCPIL